jgi:hypothetical protein
MSSVAAAAAGGDAPPAAAPSAATLDAGLKAQFYEQLVLTAIRVPKQSTSQYMKLLSK